MATTALRQPDWLRDMPVRVGKIDGWARKGVKSGEVTVTFKIRGQLEGPYTYEELRVLRELAIAQHDTLLSDVIKGHLMAISGDPKNLKDGRQVRTGNCHKQLGEDYGHAPARREALAAERLANLETARAVSKAKREVKARGLALVPEGTVRLKSGCVKRK